MRKIIITFVISAIVAISGVFALAMELSQIRYDIEIIDTDDHTSTIQVPPSLSQVTIYTLIDNYASSEVSQSLQVESMSVDLSLQDNQIVLEYPDVLTTQEFRVPPNNNMYEINFYCDLNQSQNPFKQATSWEHFVQIWKKKEVHLQQLDENKLNLKIRYGKNLEGHIYIA